MPVVDYKNWPEWRDADEDMNSGWKGVYRECGVSLGYEPE